MAENKIFKIIANTKGAVKGIKDFSKSLKGMSKTQKLAKIGFKGIGTAMKGMGIGLIIPILAALLDAFKKNQKFTDLMARATDLLSKAVGILVDIFVEALKVVDLLTFGMLNLSGASDGASQSIQQQRNEFQLMEAGMEKIKLQYETQAEKLRQVRDDESLTMQERMDANTQLGNLLEIQYEEEKANILRMIEIRKNELKLDKHNIELKKQLIAAETMLAELENRVTGQRSEQLVNINSLKREQLSLSKSSTKATKKEVKSVESMIAALDKYGGKLVETEEEKHKSTLAKMEEEYWDNILTIRNQASKKQKKKQRTEYDDDLKENQKILENQKDTLQHWYQELAGARNENEKAEARDNIRRWKETIAAQEVVVNTYRDARETTIRNNNAYSEEELKLISAYNEKKKKIEQDYAKKKEDDAKKEADRIIKINKDAMQMATEDLNTDFVNEYLATEEKYQLLYEQEGLHADTLKELKEREKRDLQAIEDKYDAQDAATKKANRDSMINSAISLANSLTQISASKAKKEISILDKQLKDGTITEEEYNKKKNAIEVKQHKKEKAAALLGIAVDTARGISQAVAAGSGIPFPGNLAAIAAGVAAVVAGVAQASTIMSEPPPELEELDLEDDTDEEEESESILPSLVPMFGAAGSDQAPVQAFVVESDVSDSQALADDLNLQATL